MRKRERNIAIIVILIESFLVANSTTITLSFSNGYNSQFTIAKKLIDLKFNATFFLNSANIEFKTGFMNVFDINWLVENTFEIGGHCIDHIDLSTEDSPTVLEQICRNRATLIANGWKPKSFHYPYGRFNTFTDKIVKECGYNSALILNNKTSIVYIQNQFELPIYDVDINASFEDLVNHTITTNGWTIFNFHDVDVDVDGTIFQFLEWLEIERDGKKLQIKSIDTIVNGLWIPIPDEYINTPPTPIPDKNARLKFIIGTSCIGILVSIILYVIVTTQIKRRTKIKFIC